MESDVSYQEIKRAVWDFSEVQSAFLADRQILDGPFILNEVLQWCKVKKKQTFIFKIDFEKAYDSVRWDFLGDVLSRFGFGSRWCGWIQECLQSSRGSMLVNGIPTQEFQFYKGLKQGDLLSPFLFILVMESLHLSFKRVEDADGHASIWCDIIKEMDRLATQGIDLSLDGVLLSQVEDRWKWVLNGSGVFTVASARQYIDNKRLPETSSKTRWIKDVLIKVNIHAWKVSLDSLPTRWNISRRAFPRQRGVGSWFSQLKQASIDFNTEGRIAWVDIEGIPFKLWSGKTFKRIATEWGVLLDIDDQEEMCFHSKRLCIHTKIGRSIFEEFKIIFYGKVFWIRAKEAPRWVPDFMEESDDEEHNDDDSKDGGFNVHESGSCGGDSDVEGVPKTLFEEIGQKKNNLDEEPTDQQDNHSEDPFSIYTVLKKKKDIAENENNSNHNLKFPLGFTPNEGTYVVGMHAEESKSNNIVNSSDRNVEEVHNAFSGNFSNKNSKEDVLDSVCSGHFKKSEVPRTGGSLLSLMDKLVTVGQVMGYKMDGCMSNMTEIIESQGAMEVYR
nr:RNA-directed DNA polymerase, eukaryota, reverse transcriptase zinc-binding domain protein [Tanacetum cinerariifolium]